jgi:hypothetical protein
MSTDFINFKFPEPTDKECKFCQDKFKGYRDFCDKEECRKTGVAEAAYRRGSFLRSYGLIDYQYPQSRKTFLVDLVEDTKEKK